jgi:hypothetical protein
VDWLPSVFTVPGSDIDRIEETGTDMQALELHHRIPAPGNPGTLIDDYSIDAIIYKAGFTPPPLRPVPRAYPTEPPLVRERGPSIHGVPSEWFSFQHVLFWQWAPGAFAEVWVSGIYDEPLMLVAQHVAEAVRTDAYRPVAMPFTMSAPPDQLPLAQTFVESTPDGPRDARLKFGDHITLNDPVLSWQYGLIVDVTMAGPVKAAPRGTKTTIGGHLAVVTTRPASCMITVYDVNGSLVTLDVTDSATKRYVDDEAATELARSMAVVDRPTDRSTWRSSPLN